MRNKRIPTPDKPIPPEDPLYLVPIAGTEGWGDAWWQRGSPWLCALARANAFPMELEGRAFRWSTDLDGIDFLSGWRALRNMVRDLTRRRQLPVLHRTWQAGGDSLGYFLQDIGYASRNLVAHSHGGQVALYTAASRVTIRTLVTVGTPVRADMFGVYAEARKHIGWHLHICDDTFDLWGMLGQLFDGKVSIERTWPIEVEGGPGPDLTLTLRGIGHGKILRDPTLIPHWIDQGWLDLIRLGQLSTRYKTAGLRRPAISG